MGTRERKKREKQDVSARILTAAREIVINEGYEALSIRRVAEKIEYAPGTLYLYFESRDAIARALCLEVFAALERALEPASKITDPAKRFTRLVRAFVRFALENPSAYRLAFLSDPKFTGNLYKDRPLESPGGPGQMAFGYLVTAIHDLNLAIKESDLVPLAEVVWSALHGIVSLKIICGVYPLTPVEKLAAQAEEILRTAISRPPAPTLV